MRSTNPSPTARLPFAGLRAALVLMLALAGCGGGDSGAATPPPATGGGSPDTRLRSLTLEVPAGAEGGQIVGSRQLRVPQGFGIRVFARVAEARFMAVVPNGDVLVSRPSAGTITLLRPRSGALPEVFSFASGLALPHDMVFFSQGASTWLYVAESRRVVRYAYSSGQTTAGTPELIVAALPDASTPELGGSYGHPLKNIAISSEPALYVAIASTCNACDSDTTSSPVRGAIYRYDLDGKNGRLFARGIRNAEGVRFLPGTNTLWAAGNQRDNIAYPYHDDFDGDGKDDFGRVLTAFVDANPPELFSAIADGGDYGWPYCNPNPRSASGWADMPYDRDAQMNADGSKRNCAALPRIQRGLPPHSAPLGLSFLHDSGLPAPWKQGAAIGLHGCWNCSRLNGHMVLFVPFDAAGKAGEPREMVSGFVLDAQARTRWGRPVQAVPYGNTLLISDDYAGAIYQLYPTQ
ncbi:hypothetical protein [Niveibacterium sp. SC-1]|uniref:PQQ-dependent sugar dehydrogenase n=1 Tax=Niveibacterium sp. SC-1 TaxID=3135646 RepID=UPI00311DA42E